MTLLADTPFVLIRHGQTDANRDGRIAGRLEAQLTEQGRAAAAALSKLPWATTGLHIFCSPQERARQTAQLAFPRQNLWQMDGLRERDWGDLEGRPLAEQTPRYDTPPGGEAWQVLLARVGIALAACQQAAGSDLPVIVAHSGVIRAARALTGGDAGGPSPANTTPFLYEPMGQGQFREMPFFTGLSQAGRGVA